MIVYLAARRPNLRYLGCKIRSGEWATMDEEYRQKGNTKKDFADAFYNTELPASLRYVQLNFIGKTEDGMRGQRKQLPDRVYPTPFDFSSSLRVLSYQLRKMEIRVMVDETHFWPRSKDSATSSNFWPNLESLNVMFAVGTPSGSRYFKGPLGEGRDTKGNRTREEDAYPAFGNNYDGRVTECLCGSSEQDVPPTWFRATPHDESINHFLEVFANAAANMPKLTEALIWMPLYFFPEGTTESDDEYEEISDQGQRYRSRRLSSYDLTAIAKYPEANLAWGIAYVAPGGAPFDDGEGNYPSRQFCRELHSGDLTQNCTRHFRRSDNLKPKHLR
ncbi:hypothetical protein BU23DRAFT_120106 [Bimuria novae-zelandiae CBS 107.79]|uniref:Uncharacterized protein n=1 Tax=Bimuria novae-zelandiae CBS 107.79 TaxID=1447943 RepID=A0A6A5VKL3_9PLEO|nr:hypothetical protein BU23DRAFT_120106 [Bimuria novae-zelandiae CBS 107.79]